MFALLSLALGCPRAVPPSPTAAPSAEPQTASATAIGVSVVEDPASDSWTVTWRFPEPVPGIAFVRDRHRFRAESWQLLTEGLSWAEARYGEVLLAGGAPVSEIAVRFGSDFRNRPKDYRLNLPFTDGGRLLYTGYLAVHPLVAVADGVSWAPGAVDHAWQVRTSPERSVRVLDRAGAGQLSWEEASADRSGGTYLYTGTVEPLQTESLSAVIDPGMPAWLRTATLEALPVLFEGFAARTGHALAERPLILVGFSPEGEGRTLKGGSLHGLLQLYAGGEGWDEQTPEAREWWLWFLGHEAFHLWNSQQFPRRGGRSEEWASEGLSDL